MFHKKKVWCGLEEEIIILRGKNIHLDGKKTLRAHPRSILGCTVFLCNVSQA